MTSPERPSALGPNDVQVRLRADARSLPIVRTVTHAVAMRADHTIDDIADLELAVDECCSALIVSAADNAHLTCTFIVSDETITVHADAPARTSDPPSQTMFGWKVLTTLSDHAGAWVSADGDGDGHVVHVEMVKHRPD